LAKGIFSIIPNSLPNTPHQIYQITAHRIQIYNELDEPVELQHIPSLPSKHSKAKDEEDEEDLLTTFSSALKKIEMGMDQT
jgi:hypothetical protein